MYPATLKIVRYGLLGLVVQFGAAGPVGADNPVEAPEVEKAIETAVEKPVKALEATEIPERMERWARGVSESMEVPSEWGNLLAELEGRPTPRARHDLVVALFAALDPETAKSIDQLDPRGPLLVSYDPRAGLSQSGDAFYRTNVAIELMRRLVDRGMYDEALALVPLVELSEAVDPAAATFYQAVCEHQLMMREPGLKSIERLLAASWAMPESYPVVAELMKAELEALKPDSLEEIAGLMQDVERRLRMARGGQRVQEQEERITEKLDEMIKKLEEQQQQMQQASSGGGGNQNQSNTPLDDSIVKGSTAPGEVDEKNRRRGGDWGDLPPREREAAKNEIEKAFPSNYSRLINEYFLKRTRENSGG